MWLRDDETVRQRCLSLRWEHRRHWRALGHSLGVNETGAAIVLDLASTGEWVSYSRAARHYAAPRRYRNALYTFRRVPPQMDYLAAEGLILHDRRAAGARGWQSAAQATPDLRQTVAEIVGGDWTLRRPGEVILLRDRQGRLIDYRETRAIGRMRQRIEGFNEAIMGASLDPSIAAPLCRIFNRNMTRGGRFYAMGTSWQNIKAEARKRLTIGGEPVVELDYKNLHPAILYAEAGATMPADCYMIDGWPRKLVKVGVLTLINAPTIHKARHAIAHSPRMAESVEPGSQEALRKANALIDAIKRLHRPIAGAFHSDAGARLMHIDAALAEAVMKTMLMQGTVILPVHDSFLVPASKYDRLEDAMLEAAHEVGIYALEVDVK